VIIGDQPSVTRSQIYDALGSLGENIDTFKARASFKNFEAVRHQNSAMWN